MATFKIAAFLSLFVVFAQGCNFERQEITKVAMTCGFKNPRVMELFQYMQQPEKAPDMKFLCSIKEELVDFYLCFMNQLKDCIPSEVKPVLALLPNKERALDAFGFMCAHKQELQVGNNCMTTQLPSIMACYKNRLGQLVGSSAMEGEKMDYKGLFCKVIRSEEQCIRENKGSCTEEFLQVFFEALEKFFDMTGCAKNYKLDAAKSLLGSVLIHGKPNLRFRPYSVIRN